MVRLYAVLTTVVSVEIDKVGLASGLDFLERLVRQPEPGKAMNQGRLLFAGNGNVGVGSCKILIANGVRGAGSLPIMAVIVLESVGGGYKDNGRRVCGADRHAGFHITVFHSPGSRDHRRRL